MKFNITHQSELVDLSKGQQDEINDLLSWETPPQFLAPGRTAWHVLKNPISVSGKPFAALKLKGIGIWNPESAHQFRGQYEKKIYNAPHPPTSEKYETGQKVKHFGFSGQGDFRTLTSEISPFGGIEHRRALQEYEAALHLYKNKVSVTPPLLVAEYPDHLFEGKVMGVAVSLVEENNPYRLDRVLFQTEKNNPQFQKFYEALFEDLKVSKTSEPKMQRTEILAKLMQKVGEELYKFSSSGIYRHSGGLDNFYYCLGSQKVVFTDLDSSRFLKTTEKEIQPLEILRDQISVMHKFLHHLASLIEKSPYEVADFKSQDPLYAFLSAYFGGNFSTELKKISEVLWEYFESVPPDVWRSHHLSGEKDCFYIFCLIALSPLYKKTSLNEKYPNQWTQEALLKNAKTALGERYKTLECLLEKLPVDRPVSRSLELNLETDEG